jgi:type IV secretory pathway VirB2 component (pilin)
MSVSFNANAASCSGNTISNCTNISTASYTCTSVGCIDDAGTDGYCDAPTALKACSTITTETNCKATNCSWLVAGDANDNAFVTTMCNALKIVTGNGGKAFAAFAIISVGIGFFTGKISWGLMIGVTAGIAAMFGAPTIVAAIAGGDAVDCGS